MRILLALVVAGVASQAQVFAEDENYIDASSRFIQKNKTADSEQKWEKYWKGRLETAERDAGADEEHFIDRFIFDWMAGKAKKFSKDGLTVEDKLIACRLYLMYKNKNYDGSDRRPNGRQYKLPDLIQAHLTNENLDKFISDDPNLLKKVVDKAVGKVGKE